MASPHTPRPTTLVGLGLFALSATAASTAFAYRPSTTSQLLTLASALTLIGLLIHWLDRAIAGGRSGWSATKYGLALTLLGFAGCLAGFPAGRALTYHRFRSQRAAFDSLVGSLDRSPRPLALLPDTAAPPMLRGRPTLMAADTTRQGAYWVTLFYGGGFPVRHSAIVYFDGDPADFAGSTRFHWRSVDSLAPFWYYASD